MKKESYWKAGKLLVDDIFSPTKVYMVFERPMGFESCECGHTHYKKTERIIFELEGIKMKQISATEVKEIKEE